VEDTSDQVKTVRFADGLGSPVDTSFSVTVWRSVLTPPTGSPS